MAPLLLYRHNGPKSANRPEVSGIVGRNNRRALRRTSAREANPRPTIAAPGTRSAVGFSPSTCCTGA